MQSERREQHFTPGRFTPIKLPEGPPLEGVAQLLDFPRHRLRLLEKLGEGDFGMVRFFLHSFRFNAKYRNFIYNKNETTAFPEKRRRSCNKFSCLIES